VVFNTIDQFFRKIFVSTIPKISQIITQDVTLGTNAHHQSSYERVHIYSGDTRDPNTDHLMKISELIKRRRLVVKRVPCGKWQFVVFHGTIENRKKRPKTYDAKGQNPKHQIYHRPCFQRALNHSDLLIILRLKLFTFQLHHEPLQRRTLPYEHQHLGRCQQFREDRENYCDESFEIFVSVDDVCRLKENVTVDEEKDEDHVECVCVQFVEFSTRPKSCQFQEPGVHTYRGFPIEFLHLHLD
jgi:hypothetical protein